MDTDFPYHLNPLSVVFDVGGYKGDFTDMIRKKHECGVHIFEPTRGFFKEIIERFKNDPLVWPYNIALEDSDRDAVIAVRGDSTGFYSESEVKEEVRVRSIMGFIGGFNLTHIDLLKMNCEGSEYPIIKSLADNDWMKRIRYIVVQFHHLEKYKAEDFQAILLQTHHCRYKDAHWQWWTLNSPNN